jgi:hypothetical protein
LVSKDEPVHSQDKGEDEDEEEEDLEKYDRLFTFSVEQTKEEEENAVSNKGFSVSLFF